MPATPVRVKSERHGLHHLAYGVKFMKALCGVSDLNWVPAGIDEALCPLCREEWDYVRRSGTSSATHRN